MEFSKNKFLQIIETIKECYFEADLKGNLTFFNETFCNLTGYSKEELSGFNYKHFVDKESRNKVFEGFFNVYKTGEPITDVQFHFKNKSGEKIVGETSVYLKYDSKGNKSGFYGLFRDISKKKEEEERFKQELEQLVNLRTKELRESEKKYRGILEKMMEGYYEVDLKGNHTFMNDYYCKIIGYSKEELLGQNFRFLFEEESSKDLFKIFNQLYKTGIPIPHSNFAKLVTNKGRIVFIEGLIDLLYDFEGNKIGFYGFAKDITEKLIAEQELRESVEKYSNLFHHSNDGIIIHDFEGKLIDVNQKVLEQFGYTKSEILSLKIPQLHLSNELKVSQNAFEEISRKGFVRFEINFKKKNGEIFPAEVSSSLFNIGNNKYIQGILREITERKKAERLIQEEMKKLKELDKIRKDLIYRVSHELKTPLVSIWGASQFLLEKYKHEMKEEPKELIEMIEKGGRRLSSLVDNLLDITRIEYNKFELEKESNNISKIIRDCTKDLSYLTKRRKLILEVELPKELFLEVDKIRIEQVVLNLLSNAIKNTPPNGNIKINLKKKQKWAKISIIDTGIGLIREEMDRIFTRFGKIERYGEGLEYVDIQGSGLGLYLSKEIIDLHDGQIWAESEGRDKGSTFIIKLPL